MPELKASSAWRNRNTRGEDWFAHLLQYIMFGFLEICVCRTLCIRNGCMFVTKSAPGQLHGFEPKIHFWRWNASSKLWSPLEDFAILNSTWSIENYLPNMGRTVTPYSSSPWWLG